MSKRDDRLAKRAQGREKFHGFEIPESNYFRMPNTWTDICTEIDNLAELKIVQYVLRHTWGYREYGEDFMKAITIDEFMFGRKRKDGSRIDKGTGIKSDRSVRDGIECAIADGYLICIVDDSDLGRIKKYYTLNLFKSNEQIEQEVEEQKARVVTSTTLNKRKQGGNNHHPESHMLPPHEVNVTTRTEKETKERNLEKGKEDTAQSPDGDVCSSSSPLSTHKGSRPRPTGPPKEEKEQRRKPKELTSTEAAVLDKLDSMQSFTVDPHDRYDKQVISYFAEQIERGRIVLDDFSLVRTKLLENPFYRGEITLRQFKEHFMGTLTALKVTHISPSNQEDEPLPFDEHTDPRMLSNTDHMKWVAKYGPVAS